MKEKPILFNTDMVRAILDGRKKVTRRVVKPWLDGDGIIDFDRMDGPVASFKLRISDGQISFPLRSCPYRPGDILWVRETWAPMYADMESTEVVGYLYRADDGQNLEFYDRRLPGGQEWTWECRWRPSIHMPRKAARIFLRVTDVRCERLHDMKAQDSLDEGVKLHLGSIMQGEDPLKPFADLWNSTIKPKDRSFYTWSANPWVWVIEFEKSDGGYGDA